MIRVITLDREYGAGGADIARKLAERLGWKLWDQLLTDEVARLMECECWAVEEHEERKDPLRYRLFKAFMRGSLEGSQNAQRTKMVDADCVRETAQKVVTKAANEGHAVIVGRGSAYYLHDLPDCFHVFVYAPFDEKVRRLRETGKSEQKAIELVETVDRDRAAYIKQYFDIDWPLRYLFDLMINSSAGDDVVVQTILNSVTIQEKQSA